MPGRDEYWRLHAWTARVVKFWLLSTVAGWFLVGAVSVPLVTGPTLAWYYHRLRSVVGGLPRTDVRLGVIESHELRAEGHSWRALWLTAVVAALRVAVSLAYAAFEPGEAIPSLVAAVPFAVVLASASVMIRSKRRSA